jgi:hypothetical protein
MNGRLPAKYAAYFAVKTTTPEGNAVPDSAEPTSFVGVAAYMSLVMALKIASGLGVILYLLFPGSWGPGNIQASSVVVSAGMYA